MYEYRSNDYRNWLGYHNSNQYAVLAYELAAEIGWNHVGGDPDSYYTEVELEQQTRDQAERQAADDTSCIIITDYSNQEDVVYYRR